ncbi:MAG: hypothetical protein Q8S26_11570 [Azonexus sp.]|nr:hypothetical protein [Azonexus sp.]
MVIAWFNASEIVSFAEEVAREIEILFPEDQKGAKTRQPAKIHKKFESLLLKVRSQVAKSPLNIYKKAKFLNTVKWRLRDAGYEPQFISDVVALLASSLNN